MVDEDDFPEFFVEGLKRGDRNISDAMEDDETLADIGISLGAVLSEGIPWKDFSEWEIQGILKIHFENLGFKVIWRHNDDPANEKGVDLECHSKADGKTVLIAVKKKPKKEALAQIVELKAQQADERIYVYVDGAAQSFRDMIGSFRPSIEFWDEKILEEKLDETGGRFALRTNNSMANKALLAIMRKLLAILKTEVPEKPPPSTTINLDTLWALKDRATTVNKCAALLQLLFEDEEKFKQLNPSLVQDAAILCLDFIYAKALMSIQATFETMSPDLVQLLRYINERTKGRSNWGLLYGYHPGLMAGRVEMVLKQREKNHKEWEGMDVDLENAATRIEPPSVLAQASDEFRYLSGWGYGLEATIDDMFELLIGGTVRS